MRTKLTEQHKQRISQGLKRYYQNVDEQKELRRRQKISDGMNRYFNAPDEQTEQNRRKKMSQRMRLQNALLKNFESYIKQLDIEQYLKKPTGTVDIDADADAESKNKKE